ncbi:peptide deformylase [Microgenomates group bacterium RBG_16_45_19]|nr:MAG: peptide deformylase [Microgenomates group bacterium RBG_16_45_19]
MAVRETVQVGDLKLKAKNAPVTDFDSRKVKKVIADLIETMRSEQLIGMAAPQIGENFQIFATEPRKTIFRSGVFDPLRIFINPKIVDSSKELVVAYEGCGSVVRAQLFGPVRRSRVITVKALDEKGQGFKLTGDGILARVIQHEYDHLQGIEFTEKIDDYRKLVSTEIYREKIRNSPKQLKAAEITVCKVERLS